MDNKRSYWSPDHAGSCNDNEIEIEKHQMKKRKFVEDDIADYLINKSRKKVAEVCKICNKIKSCNVCACADESNPYDYRSSNEEIVPRNFSRTRPANSHLPLKIMYSVESCIRKRRENMEDDQIAKIGRGIEFREWEVKARAQNRLLGHINRIAGLLMSLDEPYLIFEKLEVKDMENLREDVKVYLDLGRATASRKRYWEALLVVCDWEIDKARKKEALDRARVRGDISSAEFLLEDSKTEADIKFVLEGGSYSEIEVLESEIESLVFSGSANVVEFWEPKLKHIRIYKAKAFLKEECHATTFQMNLEKDHRNIRCQEVDDGYNDGKDEQTEIEGGEGTGSSFSQELLYEEGIGNNFEMKTMGVIEEGDSLSGNYEETIPQSSVNRPTAWLVSQAAMEMFW
ncbi:hypothetical protein AgCh_029787 [Apium graveolens]